MFAMQIAALRFFTVYGPRQRPDLAICKFTRLLKEGRKLPVYGDGTKARDFTYIDDIIDGILKTITWVEGQEKPVFDIFNLGESQTTNVNTLVETLSKATGKPADVQYLPDMPGDVKQTFADVSKAKSVLGYDPQTKIEEGLKKYVEWTKGL